MYDQWLPVDVIKGIRVDMRINQRLLMNMIGNNRVEIMTNQVQQRLTAAGSRSIQWQYLPVSPS